MLNTINMADRVSDTLIIPPNYVIATRIIYVPTTGMEHVFHSVQCISGDLPV